MWGMGRRIEPRVATVKKKDFDEHSIQEYVLTDHENTYWRMCSNRRKQESNTAGRELDNKSP